jgi:hypothetical protein
MFFYTICTLSHLFQAEVLVNSLRKQHPDAVIKIGLVDKLTDDIDLSPLGNAEIVEVDKIAIPDFEAMQSRYKIFELCFASKPFYALYFFKKYPELNKQIYVDTDIYAFDKFDAIDQKLNDHAVIITPHITQAVNDGHKLERFVLGAGIFNAGFFAINRSKESFEFLNWFADKLVTQCIGGVGDQVWLSLVPAFFNNVLIEKGPGYNMAGWNVMHRFVTKINDRLLVNNVPLVFYHYSGFDFADLSKVTKFKQQGADINERKDLLLVLEPIVQRLAASPYLRLKTCKSIYHNSSNPDSKNGSLIKKAAKKAFNFFGFNIVKK